MHQANLSIQGSFSQSVIHAQINMSPSKQLYSFSKSQRFSNTKRSYCQSPSYELGSTLNMRSTNLGFGDKSDFTKGDHNKPGPDRYQAQSIFETNNSKNKGSTFSLGRSEIKFRQIPVFKPTPGPGQYNEDDSILQKKKIYSMGMRTLHSFLNGSNKNFPGPSQYNIQGIHQTGKYFLSKHGGSKATVFNPGTSDRFNALYNIKPVPGPGTYTQESIHGQGKYTNSKLHSAEGGKFALGQRTPWYKSNAKYPGPGEYRAISEFGDSEYPPLPLSPENNVRISQSQIQIDNGSKSFEKSKNKVEKQLSTSQTNASTKPAKTLPNYSISNDSMELAKIYGQEQKINKKRMNQQQNQGRQDKKIENNSNVEIKKTNQDNDTAIPKEQIPRFQKEGDENKSEEVNKIGNN